MTKQEQGYLSEEEGNFLLMVARQSAEGKVRTKKLPDFKVDSEKLLAQGAAFVTIHKRGMLRGCIGHAMPHEPLIDCVRHVAAAAALEDPRFPSATPEELESFDYEVSVLSPFERQEDPEKVEVGRDGLYIKRGPFAGLLLPQVATEHHLDRDAFLEQVCLKAGLPKSAWRDDPGVELYVFEAQIFEENGNKE